MKNIRVRAEAPANGESLCRTCTYVHMQKGFRGSEELIYCTFGCYDAPRFVPFKVAECTDFTDRDTPSREQMEKIALLVEPRRLAGFQRHDSEPEEEEVSPASECK